MSQATLDVDNAAFWTELCGTELARAVGITDHSRASLGRFDQAYLAMYPYLARYVAEDDLTTRRVLEIGLGYGTLAELLASRSRRYDGVDIASGPVAMVNHRLTSIGLPATAVQASALALPFADGTFDAVYSIGCLHHTGALARSIDEVHRVLAPGGTALIMLYNRWSYRRLLHVPWRAWLGRNDDERVRAAYDANAAGQAAPHTDFVSTGEVRGLFARFRDVRVEKQNCEGVYVPRTRLGIRRERLLGTLGRIAGLDLYIRATR